MLQMPASEGRRVLERQVDELAAQHPGRDRNWYVDKLVADLDRARR